MGQWVELQLAPTGSTGNNAHASIAVPDSVKALVVEFVVEAVGGSPTVTWVPQESPEGPDVADGSATFTNCVYTLQASNAITAASQTTTTTGVTRGYLYFPTQHIPRRVRLLTTSNTNVTYRAKAYILYGD